MTTIKQNTPNHNIVASGSIFTFKSEPLKVEFDFESELKNSVSSSQKLTIEFNLVTDTDKGRSIESEPATDTSGEFLKIKIYNAEGVGGSSEPIPIYKDDTTGKITHLSFSFQGFSDSYLFIYTIFQDK